MGAKVFQPMPDAANPGHVGQGMLLQGANQSASTVSSDKYALTGTRSAPPPKAPPPPPSPQK